MKNLCSEFNIHKLDTNVLGLHRVLFSFDLYNRRPIFLAWEFSAEIGFDLNGMLL